MLTELAGAGPSGGPASRAPAVEEVVGAVRRARLSDARAGASRSCRWRCTSAAAPRADPAGPRGPRLHGERACSTRVPAPTTARRSAAELEDHAIRLQFEADRDGVSGELRTLTATATHAFELLRLALTEPRFDAEPVERVRSQIAGRAAPARGRPRLSGLARLVRRGLPATTPTAARPAARPRAWPRSPPTTAAPSSPAASRRDRLLVGVAGDITAEELAPLLDADLRRPAGERAAAARSPAVAPRVGARRGRSAWPSRRAWSSSAMAASSATIPTTTRRYVANYILGGGGFSSRLLEEVREKRGLAYSAYSYLYELDTAPLWLGGVATNNEQVAQSLAIVRGELARMAARRARRDRPRRRPDLPHRLVPAAPDQQRPGREDAGRHAGPRPGPRLPRAPQRA